MAINVGTKNTPIDSAPSKTSTHSNTTITTRDRYLAVALRSVNGNTTSNTGIATTINTRAPSLDNRDTRVVRSTPVDSERELVPRGSNAAPSPVSTAIAAATRFHRRATSSAPRSGLS